MNQTGILFSITYRYTYMRVYTYTYGFIFHPFTA